MYLDFERYKELGGSLEPPNISIELRRAERFIDRLTFGRVKKDYEVLDKSKIVYKHDLEFLLFKLIELKSKNEMGKVVTSESNQGMSRSYAVLSPEQLEIKSALLVNDFLTGYVDSYGVRLLYRGVSI